MQSKQELDDVVEYPDVGEYPVLDKKYFSSNNINDE